MKHQLWTLILCTLLAYGFSGLFPAYATSVHYYKPNEYAVVQNGISTSKRFSVAAHGIGDSYDGFHLYLMEEPGHKKIGVLEEVGPELLDTGADAYRAVWSPDSHYVELLYRADRHAGRMVLYRIENRRAYPISGPSLLSIATRNGVTESEATEETASSFGLAWASPTRFTLQEQRSFKSDSPDLAHIVGRFGREQSMPEDIAAHRYFLQFSAVADCEFSPGNKYQVINLNPGRFDD